MLRQSMAATCVLLLAVVSGAAASGCGRSTTPLTQLQSARSGALEVVLLSDHDAIRHGKDTFVVEFKSADGSLVDVGTVRASASMPMGGAPMFGSIDVQRTGVPGRYAAASDFSMAGTWRLNVEWDGPAGRGSVGFSGNVQ
jgi:hypothetical protein